MTDEATIRIKVQLYCGGEIAMGPGKADLLEAIEAHGSISAAGRVLGMSYRRAWLLVDTMNRCWREPLVDTFPGGAHGHGARLSALGGKVLRRYRDLQGQLDGAGQGTFAELADAMLARPKVSQKA